MVEDTYADFAERYDRFDGPFGQYSVDEVALFRTLFEQSGVKSVLDCACGTGRHLPLFHQLGCDVVGSDISDAMLAQARRNLAAAGLQVPLYKADFRVLPEHFDRQFDAVACLDTSLPHVPDETEALRALKSMRAVLREGGILILTQGTTDRQWREKPRFILAVNEPDFTRLFVIDYVGDGARYNVLDIYHAADARDFKVWSVEYPRMYLKDDYERLLQAAGFRRAQFYGSYALTPYDKETSGRLIVVAWK